MSKNEETVSVLYLIILIMVIVYVQEGSMICGGVKGMNVKNAVISMVYQPPELRYVFLYPESKKNYY